MLYTVARMNWAPGDPLTPTAARVGLRRSRGEARSADGPTLAVALRYDRGRGMVVAEGVSARGPHGPWSAPAVVDAAGVVTVLAEIPAGLVRVVGPPEFRGHSRGLRLVQPPHAVAEPASIPQPTILFEEKRKGRRSWRVHARFPMAHRFWGAGSAWLPKTRDRAAPVKAGEPSRDRVASRGAPPGRSDRGDR